MTRPRIAVLLAAICLLIALLEHRPRPVKDNQVPYCVIDERVAMKHPLTGEWLFGWGKGYGPCSRQDIFREI